MNNNQNLNVGEDSVVIGNVIGDVGSGSVVIGATDSKGNTIINKPMAIGKNAKAGPGSIAIGANAGSGSDVFILLDQLRQILEKNGDSSNDVIDLIRELKKTTPDKTIIDKLWGTIKSVVIINEAVILIAKISSYFI